ncbi:WD40-repeat-containing domain protein [Leucosporidium creatinivorum]|uniref:WD40-repeat-containing domain protein n=1 Tax=Leucosporidium creatinivorum TaxID=106004 RepID=A0A1Y2FEN5_9BASI|nr:WD40-repeat-containing domain protein [Leucosporidium creatinivorum]
MAGGFDSDSDVNAQSGEDGEGGELSSEEDDELETPAQKRLRLSQMYLKSLEKDVEQDDGGFDAADLDRDIIAERLQQDVLQHSGKLHLSVASSLLLPIPSSSIYHTPSRAHRGPITSATITPSGHWLYTASKDGSIIKWDLRSIFSPSSSSSSTSKEAPRIVKAHYFPKRTPEKALRNPELKKALEEKGKAKELAEGHEDEVLCLAVSEDGKVLASGGRDKVVGVWDVEGEKGRWLRGLGGHKDRVASIAFRLGTHQLYSSSFDRTLKLFDLSTLSYIETLFGHQDAIQHLSALRSELAVSAGGRDKTCRFWKVTEESQLVFRGGVASRIRNVLDGGNEEDGIDEETGKRRRNREKGEVKYVEGSIDVVAMVDDTTFLSGGDSGSICLWTITKKKPIASVQLAHGVNEYESETEGVIGTARWITALACLPYGDTFASGSWDGHIRLWFIDPKLRSFTPLTTIPATGFINTLQLILPSLPAPSASKKEKEEKALVVVAAVAKEPRLGRWMRFREGKEGAVVAVVRVGEGARVVEE